MSGGGIGGIAVVPSPVVSGGGIGGIAVVASPVVVSGGGIGGTAVVPIVSSSSVVGCGIGGTTVVLSVPDALVVPSVGVGGTIGGIAVVNIGVIVGSSLVVDGVCVVSLVASLVLFSMPQALLPSVTAISVVRTSAGPGGSGVSEGGLGAVILCSGRFPPRPVKPRRAAPPRPPLQS